MVHFAADTELVYMCSELKGKASFFIPFNKGLNDGKPLPPYGAGNPVNPHGLRTHYLWESVLSKDSLANIIKGRMLSLYQLSKSFKEGRKMQDIAMELGQAIQETGNMIMRYQKDIKDLTDKIQWMANRIIELELKYETRH